MNHQLLGSMAVVLALTTAVACEKRTSEDATGRTQTTSAESNRDSIGEDLRQAGKKLGSAAEKTAEEVKEAAEKVDVRLVDKDACDGGVDGKGRACDGGAATKPRP
jgi:hypothetical protein